MPRRLFHVLAITLVATALCAGRAVVAPSPDRGTESCENTSLVRRLSSGLRRTVTPVRLVAQRQFGPAIVSIGNSLACPIVPTVLAVPVTPEQLPLPPPGV
jgi:hypothetical protein